MRETLRAHIALFVVALIYGANYVIAKSVMPDPIQPRGFIVTRVLGAIVLFWIIRLWIKEKVAKKDLGRLMLCGLTGVATNQILFFEGLNLTSPVNASIIMTSNPILVMVLAAVILKNRITRRKLLGVLLGAIGAITLILVSSSDGNVHSSWLGDLFILINATSYGVYLVLVKPLMTKYKPITVICWVFLFGSIIVVPVGAKQFMEIGWSAFTPWQIFSVIFVVIATTFFAYLLNIYALKKVQPTVASSYIYLQPILAGLGTVIFATATSVNYAAGFGWIHAFCAILIFIGVFLVSRGTR
jgi:drug/metabolite transporter (DMT)-like permease